jgi:hypothetical protein
VSSEGGTGAYSAVSVGLACGRLSDDGNANATMPMTIAIAMSGA